MLISYALILSLTGAAAFDMIWNNGIKKIEFEPVDFGDDIYCNKEDFYLKDIIRTSEFAVKKHKNKRFAFAVLTGICINSFDIKLDYFGFMFFEEIDGKFRQIGVCNDVDSCQKISDFYSPKSKIKECLVEMTNCKNNNLDCSDDYKKCDFSLNFNVIPRKDTWIPRP